MHDLHDFLTPVSLSELNEDQGYTDGQLAKHIAIYEDQLPDIGEADIVLAGVTESRGNGMPDAVDSAADAIRRQLYSLHYWHKDVTIADIGNIKTGASMNDSYAAIRTVVGELLRRGKKVVLIGGSHDITLAQYAAYKDLPKVIEATCIDACIDLKGESSVRSDHFLMDMLTGEPNMVKHYNHIGFQSYFVHPRMLETMDKLRFDCYRLGKAKENMEEMEPVLRNTHLLSIDINAIRNSDSPASRQSPNGFTGEEACLLTRYAGMSNNLSSMGIYGYQATLDEHDLTAKQIGQMIWYFIDGVSRGKEEPALDHRDRFNEFHCTFTEVEAVFLQSKKSRRWWMQLPDKKFIACSYNDYVMASRNEIPERWLRAQERG
ncbi:MAG: formimidoylglutamase [Chitinophagaceae bacterium]|nr:formimidoylglutamase [Chitinophagaceae bacterium]